VEEEVEAQKEWKPAPDIPCEPVSCESLQVLCGEWPDGCGEMQQCGSCGDTAYCNQVGECVCKFALCGEVCCPEGDSCCEGACTAPTPACVPDCDTNECGDDGCGCTCGDCSGKLNCQEGSCVK